MSPPCPLCGRIAWLFVRAGDWNRRATTELFDYYRCTFCRLLFLWPVPSNLASYYTEDYPAYAVPCSLEQLRIAAATERYKIDLIRRFVTSGRVLEIGPGYGGFAYVAQRAGYDMSVIEMDARCCSFLERVVGVRAIQSDDVPGALGEVDAQDVIALWHVFEHLPSPWRVLDAIAARLRPGGIVVIATPNPAALQFQVFGRFWVHLDAPRHLQLVPAGILATKLRALGLSTVLCTTCDPGGTRFHDFGWWDASVNATCRGLPHLISGLRRRGVPRANRAPGCDEPHWVDGRRLTRLPYRAARKLLRVVGRPLVKALNCREDRDGHGTAYTAIFQKDSTAATQVRD